MLNKIDDDSDSSAIGGGYRNAIGDTSFGSTIGGGGSNTIGSISYSSTIGGGIQNQVRDNAAYATIPGGRSNAATNYAFAAGYNAHARHTGAFVWSDSGGTDTGSTNNDSVTFRARGGYRMLSSSGSSGTFLAPGSGTWTSMSDRNAKENFEPVCPREVLDKVAALPVSRWNYRTQPSTVRHLGPTAQDFRAAFGVGDSDTGISSVDADGVALAAIQGLNQKLEEKNAALEKEVAELKALVKTLVQEVNSGGK